MAATSPAAVSDVESRSLRALSDIEKTWAETALEDAFSQIVQQVPGVTARLDNVADDSFRRLVVQIQSAMVLRVLRNPDGVLETSIDDFRRRLDAAVSSGALYLSDAERGLLASSSGQATTSSSFTIRPWAGATRRQPDTWVPWVP